MYTKYNTCSNIVMVKEKNLSFSTWYFYLYFLLILFLNSVTRLQLISIFNQQYTYRNVVHKYNRENLKSFLDQIAFIKNAILKILVDFLIFDFFY